MKTIQPPRGGKKPQRKKTPAKNSPRLDGRIQLLRMRVATAESTLKQTRDQASQAKRRRKLAKLLAKRARKGAKQAEANLAEAREALARAETALVTDAKRPTAKRKTSRTKLVARPASASAKKRSVAPRKTRDISRGKSRASTPSSQPVRPGPIEEPPVALDAGTGQPDGPFQEASDTP